MNELDFFGYNVIEKVRDLTIKDWDNIIEGKSKGITGYAMN